MNTVYIGYQNHIRLCEAHVSIFYRPGWLGLMSISKSRARIRLDTDRVYYKDSRMMTEIPDNSINCVITSPPYFSINDYSLDGYQRKRHSGNKAAQLGNIKKFETYIGELLKVWSECERVLRPNGKLIINAPLMPMLKRVYNTHFNRHIFNIHSEIQRSILDDTGLFLLDVYIWNRTNPSKKPMFGSYPYPSNFYAQNTIEFIAVYVKDGKSDNNISKTRKRRSRLTQKEWVEYTKQVWDIPMPNKGDSAFGKHPAIMPEEIPRRCIRLFTFEGDVVLDPFSGSGTTLKMAKKLNRKYIGYEIMKSYKGHITEKLGEADDE
ncbi:DNA modification methylase [Cenarchaeum symbiosum A]|uniref:Type II methyltransferase n=1 Tax=Cenarchaeum symbiosum (strain A) TaxID=414004 RepID=A0RW03_CENSY|nr:DNA modification methylase [Cenarchaeum symbiosum A]